MVGKHHGDNQAEITFDNNPDKDNFVLSAIASDPTMIQEASDLLREEGKAWGQACQIEWQSIVS